MAKTVSATGEFVSLAAVAAVVLASGAAVLGVKHVASPLPALAGGVSAMLALVVLGVVALAPEDDRDPGVVLGGILFRAGPLALAGGLACVLLGLLAVASAYLGLPIPRVDLVALPGILAATAGATLIALLAAFAARERTSKRRANAQRAAAWGVALALVGLAMQVGADLP